jgi:hypothetical protein
VCCEEEDTLRHRGPSEPQVWTVQMYAEEESLLRPGHGPSGPMPQTVRASAESTAMRFVPVFDTQISTNTNFDDSVGDMCLDLLKIKPSNSRF